MDALRRPPFISSRPRDITRCRGDNSVTRPLFKFLSLQKNFRQKTEKKDDAMFVQQLTMSEINKDDVTPSVIGHYKSMGLSPAWAYSLRFSVLKSTAGILARDERARLIVEHEI